MKKGTYLTFFSTLVLVLGLSAQNMQSIDTIKPPAAYDNIYVRPLYSDSLVSSFVIFIKMAVKPHKHVTHTETVYVLEGEGMMKMNGKIINVKKGDMVFIPKNTEHALAVTSLTPMKVLSIQAPDFDGKDRVMTEDKK
jgi:mannose-6-phosphate isomerase-like protein (cupin superfamily)